MTSAPDHSIRPARRGRLVWLGSLAFIAVALVGTALLFVSGPVSLPLLARFMEQQANKGPAELSIGSASVDVFAEDGVRIVIRNAHLKVSGDVQVDIDVPRIEAPVNGKALLGGRIEFAHLTLEEPLVSLTMPDQPRALPEMNALVEALDKVTTVAQDEFLRRKLGHLAVLDGRIDIKGQAPRRFEGIDARLELGAGGALSADAAIAGRMGRWSLQYRSGTRPETGERDFGIKASGLTLGELVNPSAEIKPGKGLGLPLELRFEALADKTGNFLGANIVGRMVDGWFQLGRTSVRFDDAALSFAWFPGSRDITVTKSHAIYGNTQIYFEGLLSPPAETGGDWDITLETRQAQFGSSDVPHLPLKIDGALGKARFSPEDRILHIDQFGIQAAPAVFLASGSFQLHETGPYLALAANASNVPAALAKQLWPITLIPPARRWVIDHIRDGFITNARFDGAVGPAAFDHRDPEAGWSGNDVTVDLAFTGGRVQPVGDVPDIYGLSGTLKIADETLIVEAQGGKTTAVGADVEVAVPETTFRLFRLTERHNKDGEIEVKLDGDAKSIGSLVDSKPFRVLQRVDLGTDGISGEGTVEIKARFPLRKKLDMKEIEWSAVASSGNFSSSNPIKGHRIRNADVTLAADPSKIAINGSGVLDGLKADIDLLLPLGGSNIASRQGVTLKVTAKELADKGLDLTSMLSGPMELAVEEVAAGRQFDVDLTTATMRLDALGWTKAAGVPGRVTFLLQDTTEGWQVKGFDLLSEGVTVAGNMAISKKGDLLDANFSTFQLRAGDDVSLKISRADNGRYNLALSGASYDARGLIRQNRKAPGGTAEGTLGTGLNIETRLGRVTGFNGGTVTDLKGTIRTGPEGLQFVDLKGSTGGKGAFDFRLEGEGADRVAQADFADTGAVLRFLDVYKRMRGGRGALSVAMPHPDKWTGNFAVRRMAITNDEAIQRLSAQTNLMRNSDPGSRVLASEVAAKGEASFETMDIAFSRSGDTITISKGALQGAVIGGTVGGTFSLESQLMELTGTFVPIFALNNIFAKIPILGFALGGGAEEGLIGVTYRLTGPVSDPILSVNPVSAIAPGIFRKMFEFR